MYCLSHDCIYISLLQKRKTFGFHDNIPQKYICPSLGTLDYAQEKNTEFSLQQNITHIFLL